jgi:hypothetical protein
MLLVFGCHDYGNGYSIECGYGSHTGIAPTATLLLFVTSVCKGQIFQEVHEQVMHGACWI